MWHGSRLDNVAETEIYAITAALSFRLFLFSGPIYSLLLFLVPPLRPSCLSS